MTDLAPFVLRIQPDRDRLVVAPHGDVDICSADRLRTALADALDDGWLEVVVDLRHVTFMDGQGAHVLLDARIAFESSDARLTLVDGVPAVARVLDTLGLRTEFVTAEQPVRS